MSGSGGSHAPALEGGFDTVYPILDLTVRNLAASIQHEAGRVARASLPGATFVTLKAAREAADRLPALTAEFLAATGGPIVTPDDPPA